MVSDTAAGKAASTVFFNLLATHHGVKKNAEVREAVEGIYCALDDVRVRRLLTECIPRLEKTLQMSIATDITEISNFLVFADELGLKEGGPVLRRLPSYFTSENRDIKDAALTAYRKFFIGNSCEKSP